MRVAQTKHSVCRKGTPSSSAAVGARGGRYERRRPDGSDRDRPKDGPKQGRIHRRITAVKQRSRPRQRSLDAPLWLALAGVGSCTARPTQIVLHVDSNAPSSRSAQLSIFTRVGAPSLDEITSFSGRPARFDTAARPVFPGSVGLVPPAQGPRGGPLTVWAALDLPAVAGQPAIRVVRLQRLQLIEGVPQLARMYFNVACAELTDGCLRSPPAQCTVSALCLERGETCGDEGVCVPQTLPTEPIDPLDAGVRFDVTTRADTRDPRVDALDAQDSGVDVVNDVVVTPGAPRLIAPMSTSRVAQRQPSLRFELPMGATDALVELCSDRAMTMGCSSFTSAGPSAPVPATRPRGWTFWRATARRAGVMLGASPVWQFYVGSTSPSSPENTVLGKVTDLNGDGRVDLVVSSASPNEVAVFYGTSSGFAATPGSLLPSIALVSGFGASLDAAGDINGDGFGDLVVGAPAGSAGAAYVYLGSATGVAATPSHTLTGSAAGEEFGASVAGAGDVDGDGYGDLIIGAPNASVAGVGVAGSATMYSGGSGVPARGASLRGAMAGERFGTAVAGGGDLNGDGFADVVVGAPRATAGMLVEGGEARAFLGAATGIQLVPAASVPGWATGDRLGSSIAIIGDFSGNAAADVIIGGPNTTSSGVARLGRGRIGSTLFPPAGQAVYMSSLPAPDGVGTAVSSAGDVNNDGFSDFIFTGPLTSLNGTRSGLAAVCLGIAVGTRSPCQGILQNSSANDQLGGSAASVGDVNGDGFDDIAVGAPNATRAGRTATGYVRIYRGAGSSTGITATHSQEIVGTRPNQRFGTAISQSTF